MSLIAFIQDLVATTLLGFSRSINIRDCDWNGSVWCMVYLEEESKPIRSPVQACRFRCSWAGAPAIAELESKFWLWLICKSDSFCSGSNRIRFTVKNCSLEIKRQVKHLAWAMPFCGRVCVYRISCQHLFLEGETLFL